jgi:hypothetical protein
MVGLVEGLMGVVKAWQLRPGFPENWQATLVVTSLSAAVFPERMTM